MAALAVGAGCTPQHVAWTDRSAVVQPHPAQASAPEAPQGYLVLAVPPHVGRTGDHQMPLYPPVYVYDKDGRFIEKLPNNTEHPTPLPAGDYIVLVGETAPLGKFRQVQVRIDGGNTTAVHWSDVAEAHRFCALSHQLSHWWEGSR